MKKTIIAFVAIAACLFFGTVLRADRDRMIAPGQLPAAAQTFVKQYFPDQTISYATKDVDHMKTTYEVRLDDGTEIDFTSKGEWDKVDTKFKPVPAGLIPEAIASYVQANFPNVPIVKIDKERSGYDVELSNELELKFNNKGQLMYIDD